MNQLAIPVEIRSEEIARKATLGSAIELCMELGGFDLSEEVPIKGLDKGQFSRWKSGGEGIKWDKFTVLMDGCGNDAPLLWMMYQRGYDLSSIRKRESEIEKKLRIAQEEIERMKSEREVERRLYRDLRATA